MTTAAIREAARVATIVLVLVLAALVGLAVGNALNSRASGDIGAPAPRSAAEPSDWHDRHPSAAGIQGVAAAEYLDYGQRHPSTAGTRPSLTAPTPR